MATSKTRPICEILCPGSEFLKSLDSNSHVILSTAYLSTFCKSKRRQKSYIAANNGVMAMYLGTRIYGPYIFLIF